MAKDAVDFLATNKARQTYRASRVKGVKVSGTGCTYSAAIVAYLAHGHDVSESVGFAKAFMTTAIENHLKLRHLKALNHFVMES